MQCSYCFLSTDLLYASTDSGTFNRTVVHAIAVTATRNLNNKTMRARVFFADPLMPPPRHDESDYVPDYEYTFNSTTIMVECKY